MSNVKGNDIDDLFKRASDKYPLRTDSADWDKLAAALEKDPSLILPPPSMEGDRRRRRRFFWLFLLLPLGGLVYYIGQTTGRHTARTTGTVQVPSSQQAPAPAGSASGVPAQTAGSAAIIPGSAGSTATAEGSVGPTVPAEGSATPATPAQPGSGPTVPAGSTPSGSATGTPAQPGSATERSARGVSSRTGSVKQTPAVNAGAPAPTLAAGSISGEPARTVGSTATTQGSVVPARPQAGSTRPDKYGSPAPAGPYKTGFSGKDFQDDAYTPGQNQSRQGKISLTDGGNSGYDPAFSKLNWQRARIADGVALNVTVKATNTSTTAKDSSSAKSVSKKNNKNKKQSFFYAGLIVAPDLSMVKFQSVKGVGTTFGILLGYQFNQKWAIETGAYLDHKKYYTDGEYFKKSGYNPSWKLLTVDGACNMWEIPINIRYNLSSGEKTKWFATAGLSTYLMTNENYVSAYSYNGNTWDTSWDTKKPSQYWFSVFNLSVGYEQRLGKIGNLRLEPYLRIPLSGMGSGSLPIMSAGLNIGITRKLW